MTDRTIEEFRRERREQIKDRRKEFWRADAAVEKTAEGEDDWEEVHAHYQGVARTWLLSVASVIQSAADSGTEPYQTVWSERAFGSYTGLAEVQEAFIPMDLDDLLPPEVLNEVGLALDEVCVRGLNLPEEPPVVEEPWGPDELPDADDFDLPEEVLKL